MATVLVLQAALQGLAIGAIIALIALSMTLLFAVCGLVNFAHGDFLALGMYGALLLAGVGVDPYLAAPAVLVVFVAIGALLFVVLVRPVQRSGLLAGAQLTLGLVFILENLMLIGFGGTHQTVRNVLSDRNLSLGGLVLPWQLVVAGLITGVLAMLLNIMIAHTSFGRHIRAITQNPDAAALMGVRINRVQMTAFALALGLLGLSGPLIVGQFTLTPDMGLDYTLRALIVMVLGGLGNFVGSFIAGLLVGVGESVATLFFGGAIGAMVPFGLLLAVLLLRPTGLFAQR